MLNDGIELRADKFYNEDTAENEYRADVVEFTFAPGEITTRSSVGIFAASGFWTLYQSGYHPIAYISSDADNFASEYPTTSAGATNITKSYYRAYYEQENYPSPPLGSSNVYVSFLQFPPINKPVTRIRLRMTNPAPNVLSGIGATIFAVAGNRLDQRNGVSVVASDPDASEIGSNDGRFTFTRTSDTSYALTAKYTVAGTAVPDEDYEPLPGGDDFDDVYSVTFAPGSATATVDVVAKPSEESRNQDKSVSIYLMADAGYTTAPTTAPATTNVIKHPTIALDDAAQAGQIGDFVRSVNKEQGAFKHFVTPKSADANFLLKAANVPGGWNGNLQWEVDGQVKQGPAGAPEKLDISRNEAKRFEVKLVDKTNPNQKRILNTLIVWVVWADSQQRPLGGPNDMFVIKHALLQKDKHNPPQAGPATYIQFAGWGFKFDIKPLSILQDADRPDLATKSVAPAPGAADTHFLNARQLAGGVDTTKDTKWDVSRRVRARILSPQVASAWYDGSVAGPFYDGLPAANVVKADFPADTVVGNDDATTGDEINVPDAQGSVFSEDSLNLPMLRDAAGQPNDSVEVRLHFGEFLRVEIAGKWFRVSDFVDWRFHGQLIHNGQTWVGGNATTTDLSNNGW